MRQPTTRRRSVSTVTSDAGRPPERSAPTAAKAALLTVRFLTEVALLAALAVTGAALGGKPAMQVTLGVLLPAVAVAVWGRFVAPRASRRLPDPARLSVEVALFLVSAGGLALGGHATLALGHGLLAIGTAVLVRRVAPGS
jgi:hypothetical protein